MRANCVICSDIFDELNSVSAAPCGHVYHSSCLSLWLAQSHTCPQCRSRINQKNIQRLYFNHPPACVTNSVELENEILNLKTKLSAKDIELQDIRKARDDAIAFVRSAEKRAEDLQQTVYKCESELSDLRLRVKSYSKLESKLLKLEQMNVALTNDLQHLNNVQMIVNGTQKDVESILQEYNSGSEATKQLATYCTCLKRELQKVMESKNKLIELNSKLKQENGRFAAKVKFYEEALATSSPKIGKPAPKVLSSSNENKGPLFNFEPTDSPITNKPSSSAHKDNHDDISINISPFAVPFSKSKFNMCIKTSSTVLSKSNSRSDDNDVKLAINPSLSSIKKNNDNSIIRTGYNGLGGHSNFINTTSSYKKVKTLKRKV